MNDFSSNFFDLRKVIVGRDGKTYSEFRKGLSPRYGLAVLDLITTFVFLLALLIFLWLATRHAPILGLVPMISLAICMHRLSLFLHEGAHFHLAQSNKVNDLLTNIFVGVLVLVDVRTYRPGHLLHHRLLGTSDDPENSYQSRLNLGFLVRSVSGLNVLRVIRKRKSTADDPNLRRRLLVPICGVLIYLAILSLGLVRGNLAFSLQFGVSFFALFPTIASLRQLLEHRAQAGSFLEDDRPVTRLFSQSIYSSIFGAAGFNRHLLHHWDPGISYTNLSAIEEWLAATSAGEILNVRRASYYQAFRILWVVK